MLAVRNGQDQTPRVTLPRRVVPTVVALLVAPLVAVAVAPLATAAPAPSQPVYSYSAAIREHVVVTSPVDSDGDGRGDQIAVDIVRPSEPAALRAKVPVVMEASPYYACCGRGNENQLKGYAADGTVDAMPLFYDNWFVPRGYAFVGVDLAGTNRSTGCPDVGGPAEIAGAKAVVDWLNGRASAVDASGAPVSATWTTGRVGMIGKSWDATIANGVAATGVEGLDTIVPIAGISSWYSYERFNGVLRSRTYPTYLANVVSGRPAAVCAAPVAADQAAADDATGDLNPYWDARNYRTSVAKVHASVFVVHGLNDLNVTTDQFSTWWSGLAANDVPRKLWLSQEGHVDPFDERRSLWVSTLTDWFDHWLKDVPNDVMTRPQVDLERASGVWTTQSTWPAPAARGQTLGLAAGPAGAAGTLATAGAGRAVVTDVPSLRETTATTSPNQAVAGRTVFLSAPLTSAVRISGTSVVTLRVALTTPTSEVTVKLVDYGSQRRVDDLSPGSGITTGTTRDCWGESTATDSACYLRTSEVFTTSDVDVLTRGWADVAHAGDLRRATPLTPGRFVTLTVPLAAHDDLVAAGHVLGLVVTLSDREYTSPTTTGATATFDLTRSSLTLPVVGAGVPAATVAPVVPGAASADVDRRAVTDGGPLLP